MEFDSSAFASINSFGGVDYAPHNKGVTPIFFIESIQDHAASEREGRAVWIDKERVRIHVVGDSTAAAHPVDAGIIARFRDQYEAWKRKETGAHIKGTPLSKWPMSTPSLVRELEALHVFSVEDLAAISDGNIQNFTNGRAIREKAIAWLKSATDGAAVMRYASEAERLREEVAELRAQIVRLGGDAPQRVEPPHSHKIRTKRVSMKRKGWTWTEAQKIAAAQARKDRLDPPGQHDQSVAAINARLGMGTPTPNVES